MYYPFQARRCKLKGCKRFLSMSTRRTLTLGCRFPIVNWPPKKFTVSHLISVCRCVHAADRPMKRIIQFPSKSRDKGSLSNWRERSSWIYNAIKEIQKFIGKNRKKIGQKILFLSIYLLGHWGNLFDTVVGSCRFCFISIVSFSFSSF